MQFTIKDFKRAEKLVSDCNAANEIMQGSLVPLLSEAETNVFAMREVAEAYRTGSFLPQSDDMYYHYLEKMLNSEMGKSIIEQGKYLCADLDNGMVFGAQYDRYGEVYECSELIGYAAFDLGIRYYSGSSADEVMAAIDYLEIADTLFRISGAGIEQYIDAARKRLTDFSTVVPTNGVLGDFVSKYQQQLSSDIEESIWNRMDVKTQIFISTAYYCHKQFNDERTALDGEMDYSPIISLLSKALELELKKRFYYSYLNYLRHRFNNDADEYKKYNNLDPHKNRVILYKTSQGEYAFVNPDINSTFSLGSFPYIITSDTHNSDKIYPSAIDYCKDVLFSHNCELYCNDQEEYKKKIKQWLHDYIIEVEIVRPLRNQSAHPSSILRDIDAVFCQDSVIRVQHLIDKLIRLCVE